MPWSLVLNAKESKRIAQQFLEFRRKNLLTQVELSKLMGVTARTVSNIETGAYGISPVVMRSFNDVRQLAAENKKAGRAMRIPR